VASKRKIREDSSSEELKHEVVKIEESSNEADQGDDQVKLENKITQ
jgi:hypothetical protein